MEENGSKLEQDKLQQNEQRTDLHWYVVHTYSGYENKVMTDIERVAKQRGLDDLIVDAKVPMDSEVEAKAAKAVKGSKGVKKVSQRRKYPGYVMVKMLINDETWSLVRNTRGVTGFVGTGNTPVPLTDEEVVRMGIERIQLQIDIEVGDYVTVTADAFAGFQGKVTDVDPETLEVSVEINMFGKLTKLKANFCDVCKI